MTKVILLHGLYMGGWIMRPLARKLSQRGWDPVCLSYNSLRIDTDKLFDTLDQHRNVSEPCYLIGHSLGGVLLGQYAHQRPLTNDSAVVTLGSPLQGAAIAKQLQNWGLGAVLGNAKQHGLVVNTLRDWQANAALGSLAGNRSIGMGMITGATGTNSDGTVAIMETQLNGMTDHICVDATHTSMLFSSEVADQVDAFLRRRSFNHPQ